VNTPPLILASASPRRSELLRQLCPHFEILPASVEEIHEEYLSAGELAQINAIRKACAALGTFTLAGCEIYSSCEPCPMCLAAIYWARLEAIYYGCGQQEAAKAGFDDAFLYEEIRKGMPHRSIPCTQLLQTEAWEAFATWIAQPAKVEY